MEHSILKKEFYASIRNIAIPIGIQNLLFTSLNFIDTLMVGSLGKNPFSGVGLGGQYFFLMNLSVFGAVAAFQIYMNQYHGAGDKNGYHKSVGGALMTALFFSLLFAIPAFLFPSRILLFFSNDPNVVREGIGYLKIISFQMPIFAVVFSLASACRSAKNAKLPLKISVVSLLSNTGFNYVLIFGAFGIPAMGAPGAALGTVLSSMLSLIFYIISIVHNPQNPLHHFGRSAFLIRSTFAHKVIKTGIPIFLHEFLWALGLTFYVRVFSKASTDAFAAYQIANQFLRLTLVFGFGISNAATVTIGAELGKKDMEAALSLEKYYTRFQAAASIVAGVVTLIIAYFAVRLFNVNDAIRTTALQMLVVIVCFQPFRFYNGMQAAGILRSGGDVKIPVLIELSGVYLLNIPLLFITLGYLNASPPVAVAFSLIGDLVVFYFLRRRVRRRVWAKNIIQPESA